jgi:hypothetical protein
MRGVSIIFFIAAAVLSFGQATTKATSPAKADTWQKSKECASQAEKVVADWPIRTGSAPTDWRNHYSPKYDKCFVWLYISLVSKDENVFPTVFSTVVLDAFERSELAAFCTVIQKEDCVEHMRKFWRSMDLDGASRRLNGKPFAEADAAEQEAARTVADRIDRSAPDLTSSYCAIDGKAVDCTTAAGFISEHMKN